MELSIHPSTVRGPLWFALSFAVMLTIAACSL